MDPLVTSAIITSAAGGLQALAGTNQNRKNRVYNRDMYKMALKDQRLDRDYANTYNSPIEQMRRLEAAGLNPNLVYGQGVSGATGQTASSQPKQDAPKGEYYLPKIMETISTMSQAMLAVANTKGKNIENTINERTIDEQVGAILAKSNIAKSQEKVEKIKADTEYYIQQMNTASNEYNEIVKTSPQVSQRKAELDKTSYENKIKKIQSDFEERLKQMGLMAQIVQQLIGVGRLAK